MAATTKKTPAKKTAAPKKNSAIQVTLEMTRETKNTYRFENGEDGAAISTLYVNKSAFSSEPSSVTVTVTVP